MNKLIFLILCCLLATLFAGCSGNVAFRSEMQSQAATQLERGIRAEQKGEILQAEKYLADSLRISSSIEDNSARITSLINLARLNRLNNKPASATPHIDQAIKLSEGVPILMAEAAYEKALIELAQNHIAEALTWAVKSLSSDNAEPKGKRLNLIARIHRAAGNKIEASSYSVMAREENHGSGQSEEEANSLRLLGSIAREERRFDEAGKLLMEALEIDKHAGESVKIAHDLNELAALANDLGDLNMMLDYLERALSVQLNGNRIEEAAATQLRISEIYRKAGKISQAEKAMQDANQLMRKENPRATIQ